MLSMVAPSQRKQSAAPPVVFARAAPLLLAFVYEGSMHPNTLAAAKLKG